MLRKSARRLPPPSKLRCSEVPAAIGVTCCGGGGPPSVFGSLRDPFRLLCPAIVTKRAQSICSAHPPQSKAAPAAAQGGAETTDRAVAVGRPLPLAPRVPAGCGSCTGGRDARPLGACPRVAAGGTRTKGRVPAGVRLSARPRASAGRWADPQRALRQAGARLPHGGACARRCRPPRRQSGPLPNGRGGGGAGAVGARGSRHASYPSHPVRRLQDASGWRLRPWRAAAAAGAAPPPAATAGPRSPLSPPALPAWPTVGVEVDGKRLRGESRGGGRRDEAAATSPLTRPPRAGVPLGAAALPGAPAADRWRARARAASLPHRRVEGRGVRPRWRVERRTGQRRRGAALPPSPTPPSV